MSDHTNVECPKCHCWRWGYIGETCRAEGCDGIMCAKVQSQEFPIYGSLTARDPEDVTQALWTRTGYWREWRNPGPKCPRCQQFEGHAPGCSQQEPDETKDQSRTITSLCDRLERINKMTRPRPMKDPYDVLREIEEWSAGFAYPPGEPIGTTLQQELKALERTSPTALEMVMQTLQHREGDSFAVEVKNGELSDMFWHGLAELYAQHQKASDSSPSSDK